MLLGAAAGLFWAASDTAIKALSGEIGDAGWTAIVFSPLAVVIALCSAIGLVLSARSLQVGKAVPVIALTSVAANALTIAAGPLVFAEPFPDEPLGGRGARGRLRARDRRRGAHPRPGGRRASGRGLTSLL